jgi:hypothetical protein
MEDNMVPEGEILGGAESLKRTASFVKESGITV